MMRKTILIAGMLGILNVTAASAQITLSLDECRDRAVRTSRELDQARIRMEMAGYDRKIARAHYLPSINATGAYLYNNRDIALISDEKSDLLPMAGTLLQGQMESALSGAAGQFQAAMTDKMTQLMTAIQTNPALAAEYMGSPMWQTVIGMLQGTDPGTLAGQLPDIATPVNAIGADLNDALHPDMHNLWLGAITLQQPVFAGGKILYSNQMAALSEELAQSKYDMQYADVIVDVDQAYWQIVSIANKKKLAEAYAELLHHMEKDMERTAEAGLATESDILQIKVKANEADMLLTKAGNGLELAKMLLCKRIGLPLESDIRLVDEALDIIPQPVEPSGKELEQIYSDRPETRSLQLAGEIYDRKAKVARADLMPTLALTANYLLSNPNAFNGIQNTWNGGMFTVGVMVSVPLFHGGGTLNQFRKAKAEARLYQDQYQDARELVELQVARERKQLKEAHEKLAMTESNLTSAEENLRQATVGFEAGVTPTDVVLAAHTAWLSAHSDYIDAGIGLQMACDALQKAEGNYREQ